MTTTFVDRGVPKAALVTLFESEGSWKKVFGYYPTNKDIGGRWPFLVIRSGGTNQEMEGLDKNPSQFTFVCTTFAALADDDGWVSKDGSDMCDDLDRTFRQVIRDNAAGVGGASSMEFSRESDVMVYPLHNTNYLVEIHVISVNYSSGGV